jgi:hypothetical protein
MKGKTIKAEIKNWNWLKKIIKLGLGKIALTFRKKNST